MLRRPYSCGTARCRPAVARFDVTRPEQIARELDAPVGNNRKPLHGTGSADPRGIRPVRRCKVDRTGGASLPPSDLAIVERSGHWVHVEQPDAVAHLILDAKAAE